MAKPRIEKDEESLHKLVRDYWESIEMEEQENMKRPEAKNNRVSRV